MENLFPLIRTLRIDLRDIFSSEMDKESPAQYQLQPLINDYSGKEDATLTSVFQEVILALIANDEIPINGKEPAALESGQ